MVEVQVSAISYDIETLPLAASLAEPYPEEDRDPPANYKSDDAIARWREKDKASWAEARVKECSLNPRLGRVCAIGHTGIIKETGEQVSWAQVAETEADEGDLLDNFWTLVGAQGTIVGWNSHGFDLPFLVTRSMLNGIQPPQGITNYLRRYSYQPHFDVKMALLNWPSGYAKGNGLDEWAKAFGLEGKSAHGSEVYGMAERGEWDKIGEYAADDARLTWELAKRVGPWMGVSL